MYVSCSTVLVIPDPHSCIAPGAVTLGPWTRLSRDNLFAGFGVLSKVEWAVLVTECSTNGTDVSQQRLWINSNTASKMVTAEFQGVAQDR